MQEKGKPVIRVRKARSSDRDIAFRFCRRTWSWGDYVPKVWSKWISDKNGRLFVATIDSVPVGISDVSIDKPREAWLRGARTDRRYRRMGVATALTRKCLEYAKSRGVKVARLATQSENSAAQVLLKKLGFRPVSEFADAKKEDVSEHVFELPSQGSSWANAKETNAIWVYLRKSRCYREAAGLYTIIFQYFSLDRRDLKSFIEQNKAIVHKRDSGEVDGLVLVDDAAAREWHQKVVQTCYVDGGREAVFDMMKLLMQHCTNSGIKKIRGFAPKNRQITAALDDLGFEVSESGDIIYEKKI